MIKLVVNADDFGYSRGVNFRIMDSHKRGIVNSATMMMNMPGTEHAIALAKENPTLQVGIHLVLTCGKPLLKDVPSLLDENGDFKRLNRIKEHSDIHLIDLEREWTAQIEKFLASGLVPTHLDSHHHVHGIKEFSPVIKNLAIKYDLAVRLTENKLEGVQPFTDLFFADFYGETIQEDYFKKLIEKAADGQSVEIMCHPGYVDDEVMNNSSYNIMRVRETSILTSVILPDNVILV
ncbi:chitin disaccharide deacetylase [Neobacillus pocheonensis]|uniref:Carbohydrate deacetylase n=1 Tax=Neobacillus pocheonensis TaxID=363869 RepID=A0ABT0WDJ8_9BACI|nr:chitin disaccharide deacetylase [Neobacillus pocheonensis]